MTDYDKYIRKVPDFPKKGILFYDITSLIANPEAMKIVKDEMINLYKSANITKIIAVESRGFIFAPLLGEALGLPVVLARKKGKLPGVTYAQEYELEYGTDIIEIQKDDISENDKILIVDDLIATGGTLKAIIDLVNNNTGAAVTDIFAIIGLPFLDFMRWRGN